MLTAGIFSHSLRLIRQIRKSARGYRMEIARVALKRDPNVYKVTNALDTSDLRRIVDLELLSPANFYLYHELIYIILFLALIIPSR